MSKPPISFEDYKRIYQTIYSVIKSAGFQRHRSCLTFATAGMLILRNHYGFDARLSAGSMALMANEESALVLIYGREVEGRWIYDTKGFHAWVEVDGWLVDFMAPIMGQAFVEDGHRGDIPRRMLQKRLADRKDYAEEVQHEGEFFCQHDKAIAESLLDSQPKEFFDLVDVCLQWYRKPPKEMPPLARHLTGSQVAKQVVPLQAPSIDGTW